MSGFFSMILIPFDQGQRRIGSWIVRRLAWARPHVVGIGQPQVLVEAMMRRQKLAMVTQVPLAEDGRVIPALFEDLGKRPFVIADADPALRTEGSQNPHAVRITSGQKGGPRCRADALSDAEAGEPPPFLSHAVEIGRANTDGAKAAEIAVTHVIGVDNDEIGQRCGGLCRLARVGCPARQVTCCKHEGSKRKNSHQRLVFMA